MNVKDMIEQLNIRVVRQLIQENGWEISAEADEAAAKETLSRHLLEDESIRAAWNSLTVYEKNTLLYFLFTVGHDIVTYRQMETFAYASSPIEVYAGLTGIRRKGIVYTLRRLWGEMAYCIPYDLQAAWRSFLCTTQLDREDAEEVELSSAPEYFSGQGAAKVVYRLLQQHRYQGIPLTKRGLPTAKARRLWEDIIPYEESLFQPLSSQPPGDYSAREYFFLHMMLELELLEKRENDSGQMYTVREEAVRKLFSGNEMSVQLKLYMYVKEKWSALHPLYPVIWEWLERGRKAIVSFRSLIRKWEKLAVGHEVEQSYAAWEQFGQEVLPMLHALGFLSSTVNPLSGDNAILRWIINLDAEQNAIEEGERLGYVQPTFEVLLLPHASYDVRWELGRYGELIQQQEVWAFELTKQSVRRGEETEAVDKLIPLLLHIQGEELPDSVVDQIKQWLHQERQVELLRVELLRCPDAETADWIQRESTIRDCWQERINRTDFIVYEHKEEQLQSALEKWSIKIKKPNNRSLASDQPIYDSSQAERTEHKLEEGYKVESIVPVLEDALPELKEIPAIWHKNWQRYHTSTLRSLLSKAQSLSIPVRMEAGGNEWEHIRVTDMITTNGEQRIAIRCNNEMKHVSLEEIGRIKLELPLL